MPPAGPRFNPALLLAALHQHGVEHVVIGAVAARLHGAARHTTALDTVPGPDRDNMDRLAGMLTAAHAQIWLPDFRRPLDVRIDADTLTAARLTALHTRHGNLTLIPRPAGLPGGYRELADRADLRTVHGIPVHVAATIDLLRSAVSHDRDKDRANLAALQTLHRLTDHDRHLTPTDRPPEPDRPGRPPPTDPLHQALAASGQLAIVFDEIRPAVAAVRRQLRAALDDAMYDGPPGVLDRRIRLARTAVAHAHDHLTKLTADLPPAHPLAELPNPLCYDLHQPAAGLTHRAHSEVGATIQALASAGRGSRRDDLRGMLTEARLHASAADGHLDLLEVVLERTARGLDRARIDQRDRERE